MAQPYQLGVGIILGKHSLMCIFMLESCTLEIFKLGLCFTQALGIFKMCSRFGNLNYNH